MGRGLRRERLETCAGCGGANSGNPYRANGTPGCSDFECCEAVCAIDAFCCSTEWDTFCAEKAITNCTNCGDDDAGSPYQQHDAGSDDRSCCDQVCSTDSFCCGNSWDAACVTTAVRLCAGCGDGRLGPPSSSMEHRADDAECCVAVCSNDPCCCEIEWDNSCAFIAATRCYGWCRGDLDFDGKISGEDLAIMLANWGSSPTSSWISMMTVRSQVRTSPASCLVAGASAHTDRRRPCVPIGRRRCSPRGACPAVSDVRSPLMKR